MSVRLGRLILLGALVLLAVGVFGSLFYQYARESTMMSAPVPPRFEYQTAEKTSASGYEPQPTPSATPPSQQPYVSAEPPPSAQSFALPPPPPPAPPPSPQPTQAQPLPELPWPPPKASAWSEISRLVLLRGMSAPTFGHVKARLGDALDAAGYYQRSLFGVPNGFAMVTQLERIDNDGVPAGSGRWQVAETSTVFSLVDYLKRLLYAEPGRYRLVVLIVSDTPFAANGGYLTAGEAADLASKGVNTLPQNVADQRYSLRHNCTALIYEFRKVPDAPPEFVAPSPLQGREHLVRAKIWSALLPAQK